MEKLQEVLKYSRMVEEEHDVKFSVASICDIVDEMKTSKYIRGEKSVTTSD